MTRTEKKIELILLWCETEGRRIGFNDEFIRSVSESSERFGSITKNQQLAIANIYAKFHISEWAKEKGHI